MMYAAAAAIIIGTVVSAYSVYSQGQQASAQAEYQAMAAMQQASYQKAMGEYALASYEAQAAATRAAAEANAMQFEAQAKLAQQAGDLRVADAYKAGERLQSTVRASVAKSGVDTTGSPLDVQLENAAAIEEEAERLRYATAVEVHSAKTGAAYSRFAGDLDAQGIERESVMRQFGYSSGMAAFLGEAGFARRSAGYYTRAGAIGAGGSILAGTGELLYRYPTLSGKKS